MRRAGGARAREHGDHISERVEFFDMFWGPNLRSYIFRGNLRYFPTQNWFGFWFWYFFSIFNISLKKVSSSRPNPPSGGGRMLTGKKRGNSDPRRSTRQTAVHLCYHFFCFFLAIVFCLLNYKSQYLVHKEPF